MQYVGGKWVEDNTGGPRINWPVKPVNTPAMAPQDTQIRDWLLEYDCESFRVNDGWAVVHGDKSTVIAFHAPLHSWEKILQELVRE